MLKLDWMFKDELNFMGIVNLLNSADSVQVLETEFVEILMAHFWAYYQKMIIIVMLIPFIAYMSLSFAFMYSSLSKN